MRTGKRPTLPPLVIFGLRAFDQAEVGRGAAGVQRHEIGKAGDLRDHRAAERARGRSRQRRRDRLAHDLIGAGDAARRLHHQERLFVQFGTELVANAIEITAHVRLDERVDQRRHGALVFAVFGQHVAGQRQRAVRIFRAHDFRRPSLMGWVGVGMQQTDADGIDARFAKEPRRGADALLVERPQLFAEEVEAAACLPHIAQRDDALRLHPEIRIAVALGHRLAGDFQDMTKAVGDDQAKSGNLALQERIGRDRRAMRQHGELVDAGAPFAEDRMDAANQRNGRIGRRRRNLGHPHRARFVVDANDVGKSAAGIDADPQRRTFATHNSCPARLVSAGTKTVQNTTHKRTCSIGGLGHRRANKFPGRRRRHVRNQ